MHACLCVCVGVCVFLFFLHTKIRFTIKVRTCLGSEDILADHHHFKTVIKLLRLGFKVGVKVKVRRLVG